MTLDLTDEQTAALLKELDSLIAADRFPFSPRIQMLKAIRTKLRPEPGARAVARAEAVRAAASYHSEKTATRVKSQPGPPVMSAPPVPGRGRARKA
jgi:hypothetical protein